MFLKGEIDVEETAAFAFVSHRNGVPAHFEPDGECQA
jgi:hypothetical protein